MGRHFGLVVLFGHELAGSFEGTLQNNITNHSYKNNTNSSINHNNNNSIIIGNFVVPARATAVQPMHAV
jgi:hypothetical protein